MNNSTFFFQNWPIFHYNYRQKRGEAIGFEPVITKDAIDVFSVSMLYQLSYPLHALKRGKQIIKQKYSNLYLIFEYVSKERFKIFIKNNIKIFA